MEAHFESPIGRRELALETRKLIDYYRSRKITFEETEKQLSYWVSERGEYMFNGDKWNSTYALHVGKKRLEIIEGMMPNLQLKPYNY